MLKSLVTYEYRAVSLHPFACFKQIIVSLPPAFEGWGKVLFSQVCSLFTFRACVGGGGGRGVPCLTDEGGTPSFLIRGGVPSSFLTGDTPILPGLSRGGGYTHSRSGQQKPTPPPIRRLDGGNPPPPSELDTGTPPSPHQNWIRVHPPPPIRTGYGYTPPPPSELDTDTPPPPVRRYRALATQRMVCLFAFTQDFLALICK